MVKYSLRNKGQEGMEYLMTYAWAALVVISVGVALWQMGVLSGGSSIIQYDGLVRIRPVEASTGWSASNQAFTGQFVNTISNKLYIYNITFTDPETNNVVCRYEGGFAPGGVLEANRGQNFAVIINDQTNAAGTPCLLPSAPEKNNYFQVDVEIEFEMDHRGVTTDHTESGTLSGQMEP